MSPQEFRDSLTFNEPPQGLSVPLQALWWDGKGNWSHAHEMVNEMDSGDGMAVHAYLHRREGALSNADYWYSRAGRKYHRPQLTDEWQALVDGLLA